MKPNTPPPPFIAFVVFGFSFPAGNTADEPVDGRTQRHQARMDARADDRIGRSTTCRLLGFSLFPWHAVHTPPPCSMFDCHFFFGYLIFFLVFANFRSMAFYEVYRITSHRHPSKGVCPTSIPSTYCIYSNLGELVVSVGGESCVLCVWGLRRGYLCRHRLECARFYTLVYK